MALYAIGDIHGTLTELKTLFHEGIINPEDTVVFLGDYIDRGPDSKGVLDWLIENKRHFHFEFILGNHDIMMLEARKSHENLQKWLQFGGAETLDSYGIADDANWVGKIDPSHWAFLETCLPYLEIENYIFVHAGLESGKALSLQDPYHLFWKKYETPEPYDKNKIVICGHTSRKNGEIANFGHTVCIDTFAYGGQWLSCINVETCAYFKSNSKREIETGTT